MLDERILQTLLPCYFDETVLPQIENSYLVSSSRMGGSLCSSDFDIERTKNYPYFTLHIIFDGCSFFHIAGQDYLLKKGDAFLIAAGEEHSYHNTQSTELGLIWIELSGNSCRQLLNYFRFNNIRTIDAQYTTKITEQLIKILLYVKENPSPSAYELSAMQYTLIMYLMETASSLPQEHVSPIITTTMEYINDNFTQSIRICDLADKLNVSTTYLTSLFRKYLGASPYQYIKLKRLEYACYLLDNTELSCQEIAEKAGFYDSAHFHRIFAKNLKVPPSQYHQRNK